MDVNNYRVTDNEGIEYKSTPSFGRLTSKKVKRMRLYSCWQHIVDGMVFGGHSCNPFRALRMNPVRIDNLIRDT